MNFLDRLKKLGPAQNILGPGEGQDIRAPITFFYKKQKCDEMIL